MTKINTQTAAILIVAIIAITTGYVFSAGEERAQILSALGVLFTCAASLAHALIKNDGTPPSSKRKPNTPRNTIAPGEHLGPPKIKRAWVTLVLATVLLSVGCSGSALRIHAVTALTAIEALEVTRLELERVTDQRMAECSDTACVDAVDADMRPVFEARDGARLAVVAYRESVSLAVGAQADDASIVALLSSSAARLACEWGSLSTAVEHLGVMLPALPAGVCLGVGQ